MHYNLNRNTRRVLFRIAEAKRKAVRSILWHGKAQRKYRAVGDYRQLAISIADQGHHKERYRKILAAYDELRYYGRVNLTKIASYLQ